MPRRESRRIAAPVMGLLAAMASVPWPARAAMNWEISPRVTLSEIFTDNVNLSPSGDEEAAAVTRFRPGVDISGRGPRLQGNLSYTLDGILSLRTSDSTVGSSNRYRDRIFHRLRGFGTAELVNQHLFVDGRVRRRQFATNLAGPVGIDNTAGFNNISSVTVVSVSPYLRNHFGSYADSTLRYSHDRVFIDRGSLADSETNVFSGTLQNGDAFNPVIWSLNASRTRTKRSSGFGTGVGAGLGAAGPGRFGAGTFNEASGTLGYQLTHHLSVSATGGYQDNEFQSIRNTIDGPFWDVGFTWVPNQRGSISARYGRRFFGQTGSLDLRYRRRSVLMSAMFRQRIASLRNVILTDAGTISLFAPDCPPSDPSCLPINEITVLRPEAVQDFFLLRQGRAAITYFTPKHSTTLAYVFLRRTIERDGAESRQQGLTLSWTWRFKTNVRMVSSVGLRQIEPLRSDREDDLWRTRIRVVRDLDERTTASLGYRHQARLSTGNVNEYDENAIIASLFMRF